MGLFATLAALLTVSVDDTALLFAQEAGGGALFGYVAYRMLRSIDDSNVEVLALLAVPLALSLPPGAVRETLLVVTYAVVVFSIAVQGLTVPRLVRRVLETGAPRDMDPLDAAPA